MQSFFVVIFCLSIVPAFTFGMPNTEQLEEIREIVAQCEVTLKHLHVLGNAASNLDPKLHPHLLQLNEESAVTAQSVRAILREELERLTESRETSASSSS